jgi:hypothetical protein
MLMDANRINDLSRMYDLFQRVNAVELLKLALSSYIRATGQGIIMDEEKDRELVPFLLDFKASLDKILEESFAKNEAFSNTIKDSFEHLINLRQVSDLIFIVLLDWCFSYCLFIDVNIILFVDIFLLSSVILFIILSGYDAHVVIM